ncbi:MAG TPA: amidohydrolase family protein, partial [Gemmatimonadaceae bacterium]|nr:amidohydrolase family protein [Gemmatimonadaceae bacterium]
LRDQLPEPPRSYMRQVYGAFFDDRAGLAARDVIGVEQLAFETDYPHQDSTWPRSVETVQGFADMLDDVGLRKVVHDNAAALLGLR